MNPSTNAKRSVLLHATVLLALTAATAVYASEAPPSGPPKRLKRTAGGLSPLPVLETHKTTNGVTLDWTGMKAPYTVEKSAGVGQPWTVVGRPTTEHSTTLPNDEAQGFFRIKSPAPNYIGAETCVICHFDTGDHWKETGHAEALDTLKAIGQGANAQCLPCHTVGYGLPSGYVDETTTPGLAGVQCENCHGPGGEHVADFSVKPKVTLTAEMCGGCHTDAHHPTYDEWESTKHSVVSSSPANYFRTLGEPRMVGCGGCHSGAVRVSQLNGDPYPSREEAATTAITCAVCHNPHQKTENPSQLRNPLKSLQGFTYNTSKHLSEQYDPTLNLCGQCHNSRGAKWQDVSRYPHYSPQYNMLVAKGGVDVGTVISGNHRNAEKQCATCHNHPHEVDDPTDANPNATGHDFAADARSCGPCHTETMATALIPRVQTEIENRIEEVRVLLDTWATTKAPEAIRTKYGVMAWEYNTPGHVSHGPGGGPTTAEQAQIPDAIKQARFNVYMVYQDGSKGVHNAKYARYLLNVAKDLINAELAK